MKIATYNILKGGSQRVHWIKVIEDIGVDRSFQRRVGVVDNELESNEPRP